MAEVEDEGGYHAEGRVSFDNGQSLYEYNLTDHLGNLRLSFADRNGDGEVDITSDPATNEILQEHHYYPFGMALKGDWVDNPVKGNNYRYNGKELNEDFGLGWYDYGARWYDAAIGRWSAVDPSSEQYLPISVYVYTANNPVLLIDPDGRKIDYGDVTKEEKKLLKQRVKYLRKNSETFNSLWRDLKRSKHVHTINAIRQGQNNSYTQIKDAEGYLDGTNRGTNIHINLGDNAINGKEVGNVVWIAHEVGHAWRNDQGKVDRASLPLPPSAEEIAADPTLISSYNVDLQVANSTLEITEETAASHIENIVRAELDPSGRSIPLREEYRNLTRVNPTFQFVDGRLRKGMDIEPFNAPTIKSGYEYYNPNVNHYNNLRQGN